MARTSRWVQTPAVKKASGVKVTLAQRIARRRTEKRNPMPKLMFVDYDQPVYPASR